MFFNLKVLEMDRFHVMVKYYIISENNANVCKVSVSVWLEILKHQPTSNLGRCLIGHLTVM